MNLGMLWFDNDPQADLIAKVERAASYYRDKYGKRPNVCFVHPSMAPDLLQQEQSGESAETIVRAGAVEVHATRSVLPNHLWIGVNGTKNAVTK